MKAEDAAEQVGGRSAQHEGADDGEVPGQRGRVQVDGEQERIEDRALHVRGKRRAGSLVRIPERELAIGVRPVGHLRPRLELPGWTPPDRRRKSAE